MSLKSTRFARATLIGAILATILVLFLTVVGELYKPLKDLLKDLHYHHWVGKGIWAAVLFVVSTVLIHLGTKNRSETLTLNRTINWLSYTLAFCTVAMFLFFIYEYTIHH